LTNAENNSKSELEYPDPAPISPNFLSEVDSTEEYRDYRYTARRYIEKVKWITEENSDILLNLCQKYISYNDGRKIVLNRVDPPNGGDKLILHYTHRFHFTYITKTNRKLDKIRKSRIRGVHIVLTTKPTNFQNIYEATKNLRKSWNKLITLLKARWGRLNFVTTLEFTHKSGYYFPHLHAIIWDGKHIWNKKNPLIPHKELCDLWEKYGQGSVTHIRGFTVNLAGYIMKYVRKQQKNLIYGALMWAMGFRAYSVSQSLNKIIQDFTEVKGEYEFLFMTFEKIDCGYAKYDSETALDIRFMLANLRDKSSVIIA